MLFCPHCFFFMYLHNWNVSKTPSKQLISLQEGLKYRCSSIGLYYFLCLVETFIRFFTLEYKNNYYHATCCE